MFGATARTERVATNVKAEKNTRHSLSNTMAANFQSPSIAPDSSSSRILSVQSRKNVLIFLASKLDNLNLPTLCVNCKRVKVC